MKQTRCIISYLHDLQGEDQHVTGLDVGATVAISIGQFAGDVELPLVSFVHQLHGLCPALDHLVGRESGRLAALVGRVELGAVDQGAGVVALARRARPGGRSTIGAAFDNLVHQPGFELDNASLYFLNTNKKTQRLQKESSWGGG